MFKKSVLPLVVCIVMLTVVSAMAQDNATTVTEASFVSTAYQFKAGDTLKYKNTMTTMMFGQTDTKNIQTDSMFIALDKKEDLQTFFGKLTIYPDGENTSSTVKPVDLPFVFDVSPDGHVTDIQGVPVNGIAGEPTPLFLPVPDKSGQVVNVPIPEKMDLPLPLNMEEKDGAKVMSMLLDQPKKFGDGGTIKSYDLKYTYKDGALSNMALAIKLSVDDPRTKQTMESSINWKSNLESRSQTASEEVDAIKKDTAAALIALKSLDVLKTQKRKPTVADIGLVIEKLNVYPTAYPQGRFVDFIKGDLLPQIMQIKQSLEAQEAKGKDAGEAVPVAPITAPTAPAAAPVEITE